MNAAGALLRAARRVRARAAATQIDPGTFVELVMRDSAGRPFEMAPMHHEFQSLAEKWPRLVLQAHYESGKTEQGIARLLWELGRSPSETFAVVSKTEAQATKTVRRIRELIETSPELRMVYPALRPGGPPWGDTALTVARPHGARTPSIQAFGIDVAVLGDRISRLWVDDASDFESSRTELQRRAAIDKMLNHLLTRVTERGKVLVTGTPFHVEDLVSTLGRQPGWHLARFPVEQPDGTPNWPRHWSKERILEARATLGPAAAARLLDLNPVTDANASFLESDISRAIQRGERGVQLTSTPDWGSVLLNRTPLHRVFLGVDPAVGQKSTNDLSAIVAVLLHPGGDREIVGCDAGRWPFGSLISHIDRMNARFAADAVAVESNAAQEWLAQQLAGLRQVEVLRHTTGRGQMSLAWEAEQLAREMRDGRWIFPSTAGRLRDPEVAALVRDMSLMTVSDRHTPDRVSGLLMARWAIDQRTRLHIERFHLDTMSR